MILSLLLPIFLFAATRDAITGNVTADANTKNDTLFETTVNVEPTFQQNESFTVQSNVMYGCVDTSLGGRQDAVCQTNPKAPECVGLKKTLENATNCLEYFVPATLGCKTYGTTEHSAEDWVAFGNNFYNTLGQCAVTKTSNDEKRDKLVSLTDMVVYDPTNPNGIGGPGILSGVPNSGANSTISQKPANELEQILQNLDDGASRLGYQTGDIIKSAQRKESFLSVVMDSPFVNDLNVVNRSMFESGIQNAELIVARVKETKNLSADAETNPEPSSPSEGALSSTGATNSMPLTAGDTSTSETTTAALFAADNLEKKVEPIPISLEVKSDFAKKPLLADRIAEIERAALEKKNNRNLASTEPAPKEFEKSLNSDFGSEDTSLFQRIRFAYKRQLSGLQAKSKSNAAQILKTGLHN
jgi:hypothetical protein